MPVVVIVAAPGEDDTPGGDRFVGFVVDEDEIFSERSGEPRQELLLK